jgi:predicted ATPase/DNA-binding SARP family transcriptional activator
VSKEPYCHDSAGEGGAPPPLTLRLFGPMELLLHGRPLPRLRSRKEPWLLALLTLHAGHELDREWLAGLLWPDCSEAATLANLRNSLKDLRRALGEDAGLLRAPRPRTLCLEPGAVRADVRDFDAAIARGDLPALECAVALYRGPLLENCPEAWALRERQVREEAFLKALETLAAHALKAGDAAAAEHHLRRAVATDPLRETAQRDLMRALAAGGNHAAALQVYRDLRLLLHQEINAAPDPETAALARQLQAEVDRRNSGAARSAASRLQEARAAAATEAPVRHNLPEPVTRFIGREREIAEVQRLLTTTRLLTITGAGGCGKSRLALEAVRSMLPELPDGAWLTELAALAQPDLVPHAVAAVLGVRERPSEPLTETLTGFLKSKRLLLLLDNCEHLLPACIDLCDTLLRRCPGLTLLATSREALAVLGETTYRVPPLSLPGEGVGCWVLGDGPEPLRPNTRTPEHLNTLLSSEAGCLFLDRAAAAQPSFHLTPENAAAVASICRRLDGIPLAIEMAAPRLRALPVEALAARLTDCFHLLTDGNRAALPRHRTLRAMIEWSYNLLSEPERALLRRLSVFADGWTLEAAEAVCGDFGFWIADFGLPTDPNPIQNPKSAIQNGEVLDLLTRLVDKSLVVYEPRGEEGRYRLLETLRQFAQEHLAASGEEEATRRRHVEYYLALAEAAEPHLKGPDQQAWLGRLEQERDNLRAVLAWAVATASVHPEGEAAAIGLRVAAAVQRFWFIRGDYTEGRGWLATLLGLLGEGAERRAEVSLAVQARALSAAGALAWPQGDGRAAKPLLQESLSLARELGDRALIAQSLLELAGACFHLGEYEVAQAYSEESLAIFRELGDRYAIARLCNNLCVITREQEEFERARALAEESLWIAREAGDLQLTVAPLCNLGMLSMIEGDFPKALAYYKESIDIAQKMEYWRMVATASGWMGALARYQRDLETARARYRESLRIDQALGSSIELQGWLTGLGCVEIMSGETAGLRGEAGHAGFRRGTRLLGAAEVVREATIRAIWVADRPDHERCVAAAREALGEAAFTAAWAEGRAMSLDAAVDYALGEGGSSG